MNWPEEPRQSGWAEYAMRVSPGLARDRSAWPYALAALARQCGFDESQAVDVVAKITTNILSNDEEAYLYCRVPEPGVPTTG
jgi:hypothetical protein